MLLGATKFHSFVIIILVNDGDVTMEEVPDETEMNFLVARCLPTEAKIQASFERVIAGKNQFASFELAVPCVRKPLVAN